MKSKKKMTKAKKQVKKVKSPKKEKAKSKEVLKNPHAGGSFDDFVKEVIANPIIPEPIEFKVHDGLKVGDLVLTPSSTDSFSDSNREEALSPQAWYDSFFAIFGFKRKK